MVLRIWQAGAEDVHRDQETDGGQRVRLEIFFFLICPSGRCHDPSPLRSLVCVLIDEVESLTAARKSSGSEPSDAIRQVINITNAFFMVNSKGGQCSSDSTGPDQDGTKCADLDNFQHNWGY